jgi:hypothetical protein
MGKGRKTEERLKDWRKQCNAKNFKTNNSSIIYYYIIFLTNCNWVYARGRCYINKEQYINKTLGYKSDDHGFETWYISFADLGHGVKKFSLVGYYPRVEAGKNTSTVIPASRKRRQKGNPVVSDETVMYGYESSATLATDRSHYKL